MPLLGEKSARRDKCRDEYIDHRRHGDHARIPEQCFRESLHVSYSVQLLLVHYLLRPKARRSNDGSLAAPNRVIETSVANSERRAVLGPDSALGCGSRPRPAVNAG